MVLVRIRDIAAPKALERKKKRARDRERKEDVKRTADDTGANEKIVLLKAKSGACVYIQFICSHWICIDS